MNRQLQRALNRGKDALFFPCFDSFWRKQLHGKALCLLYHRIGDNEKAQFLTRGGVPAISPLEFERDLRFLKEQGADFLTFSDLRQVCLPDTSRFAVIICFDDCFRDNYAAGVEVLESLNIKGVFFQSTAFIDSKHLIWEHELYWYTRTDAISEQFTRLVQEFGHDLPGVSGLGGAGLVEHLRENVPFDRLENLLIELRPKFGVQPDLAEIVGLIYPRAEQIRRAHDLGHEIGSHGHRHLKRSNIDLSTFQTELETSSDVLTTILGGAPSAFSYPFNSYLPDDDKVVSRYYSQAASVDRRYICSDTSAMWIPRFSWPGPAKNSLRRSRWLLTGKI